MNRGVVAHARVVRHRPGGGVGKFVGGAHHEPLKGVFLRPRKKIVLLGVLLKAGQLVLGQDDHFKLCGKQLVERVLDQREVAGDDDVPLQAGGAVQDKTRLLQTDGGGVVEPGVPGGGCHVRLHQGGHLFPHFGGGVHGLSSFVSAEWTGDERAPEIDFQSASPGELRRRRQLVERSDNLPLLLYQIQGFPARSFLYFYL